MNSKQVQDMILHDFGSQIVQTRYRKNVDKGLRDSEYVMISQYIRPGSFILDIGCGVGRTTLALQSLGYNIDGIDITPEMIETAQQIAQEKNKDISYKVGDATDLHYANNSIDNALFLTNGWTQIPSHAKRYAALSEIYRVLKPGGIFILIFHARHPNDSSFFWIQQWIKHNIYKIIGIPTKELEYGDMFFQRNYDGVFFDQEGFMHIADAGQVKSDLEMLGFNILFYGRENEIVQANLNDKDNVYNYAPMFAIVKK